ncbi:hypothetical protein [Bacillus sp. RO1]|uniref:hypothetical protein n=1 Tax=Bacillus sp. RO1 TaxID=2722703 RepID=UPI00145738B7|nr:hypothetical protein [Bacillus sp. RO1]NLP52032.1 hypothetical protein [Bacillus sp. RO1]
MSNITALLFDFTTDNLDAHEIWKENMTSGRNVLNDIIQFENGEFSDTPFVRSIEIACYDCFNHIKDEQMSNILKIDKENLCNYEMYNTTYRKSRSFTRNMQSLGDKIIILANKSMVEQTKHIFEIRYKENEEKWSSWQAIAGKFIVTQEYRFGPGGVAQVYSPLAAKQIANFKQKFEIRYSGSILLDMGEPNTLTRIINDPFNNGIRKIIDPTTFQILFDSQIIQEVPSEKSDEIWRNFEERYR